MSTTSGSDRDHGALSRLSMSDSLVVLVHELRNPLALIRSEMSLLQRTAGDDTAAVCARVDRQIAQLDALLKDVMALARSGVFEPPAASGPVDVGNFLSELVASIRPTAEARGVTLAYDDGGGVFTVVADEVRLMQAVTNLLTNAVKFTESGGRIDLIASRVRGDVSIRIRDTGRGIPPDLVDAVFHPFVRGISDDVDGFGVGLAVARRAIEMHGGTLTVRSEGPGRGSEFVVRLQECTTQQRRDGAAAEHRIDRLEKRRVLIVDDSESTARALARFLTAAGHEVVVANDGNAGIDAARSYHPDVVLLDLLLPDLSGREVARRIRAQACPLIVGLSGLEPAVWETPADGRALDFDAHLTKPVDPDRLLTVVAGSMPEKARRRDHRGVEG